ncbi:competence type IV pilus minor pilin ComGG [Neobacillus sp. SM06]|uniref:competence type IV pilus minor pilin ComGG n=1 Tax=Neobacillus sp. SM06 TaxID=3422492 RepID=UPI003D2D82D3
MIHSQKGFTYPLTLSLLLIFFIFFSIRVDQLLTERKFTYNTKISLVQEYYMLTTAKKVEKILQTGDGTTTSGSFSYRDGTINYQIDPPSGSIQKFTLTLKLKSGETVNGYGFYDTNLKMLTKWVEKS